MANWFKISSLIKRLSEIEKYTNSRKTELFTKCLQNCLLLKVITEVQHMVSETHNYFLYRNYTSINIFTPIYRMGEKSPYTQTIRTSDSI